MATYDINMEEGLFDITDLPTSKLKAHKLFLEKQCTFLKMMYPFLTSRQIKLKAEEKWKREVAPNYQKQTSASKKSSKKPRNLHAKLPPLDILSKNINPSGIMKKNKLQINPHHVTFGKEDEIRYRTTSEAKSSDDSYVKKAVGQFAGASSYDMPPSPEIDVEKLQGDACSWSYKTSEKHVYFELHNLNNVTKKPDSKEKEPDFHPGSPFNFESSSDAPISPTPQKATTSKYRRINKTSISNRGSGNALNKASNGLNKLTLTGDSDKDFLNNNSNYIHDKDKTSDAKRSGSNTKNLADNKDKSRFRHCKINNVKNCDEKISIQARKKKKRKISRRNRAVKRKATLQFGYESSSEAESEVPWCNLLNRNHAETPGLETTHFDGCSSLSEIENIEIRSKPNEAKLVVDYVNSVNMSKLPKHVETSKQMQNLTSVTREKSEYSSGDSCHIEKTFPLDERKSAIDDFHFDKCNIKKGNARMQKLVEHGMEIPTTKQKELSKNAKTGKQIQNFTYTRTEESEEFLSENSCLIENIFLEKGKSPVGFNFDESKTKKANAKARKVVEHEMENPTNKNEINSSKFKPMETVLQTECKAKEATQESDYWCKKKHRPEKPDYVSLYNDSVLSISDTSLETENDLPVKNIKIGKNDYTNKIQDKKYENNSLKLRANNSFVESDDSVEKLNLDYSMSTEERDSILNASTCAVAFLSDESCTSFTKSIASCGSNADSTNKTTKLNSSSKSSLRKQAKKNSTKSVVDNWSHYADWGFGTKESHCSPESVDSLFDSSIRKPMTIQKYPMNQLEEEQSMQQGSIMTAFVGNRNSGLLDTIVQNMRKCTRSLFPVQDNFAQDAEGTNTMGMSDTANFKCKFLKSPHHTIKTFAFRKTQNNEKGKTESKTLIKVRTEAGVVKEHVTTLTKFHPNENKVTKGDNILWDGKPANYYAKMMDDIKYSSDSEIEELIPKAKKTGVKSNTLYTALPENFDAVTERYDNLLSLVMAKMPENSSKPKVPSSTDFLYEKPQNTRRFHSRSPVYKNGYSRSEQNQVSKNSNNQREKPVSKNDNRRKKLPKFSEEQDSEDHIPEILNSIPYKSTKREDAKLKNFRSKRRNTERVNYLKENIPVFNFENQKKLECPIKNSCRKDQYKENSYTSDSFYVDSIFESSNIRKNLNQRFENCGRGYVNGHLNFNQQKQENETQTERKVNSPEKIRDSKLDFLPSTRDTISTNETVGSVLAKRSHDQNLPSLDDKLHGRLKNAFPTSEDVTCPSENVNVPCHLSKRKSKDPATVRVPKADTGMAGSKPQNIDETKPSATEKDLYSVSFPVSRKIKNAVFKELENSVAGTGKMCELFDLLDVTVRTSPQEIR